MDWSYEAIVIARLWCQKFSLYFNQLFPEKSKTKITLVLNFFHKPQKATKNSREVYLKVFKLTSDNGERQSIVARVELAVIDNR